MGQDVGTPGTLGLTPIPRQQVDDLRATALAGRELGWRPYSKFPVGAAVLTIDNKIYGGAGNVECANYTLTKHAEETAVLAAIADRALLGSQGGAGARKNRRFIRAVYLATTGGEKITPCGSCRQFMWEFADHEAVVIIELPGGGEETVPLVELMLKPFGPETLGISDDGAQSCSAP
jgi:cytidine deaminase